MKTLVLGMTLGWALGYATVQAWAGDAVGNKAAAAMPAASAATGGPTASASSSREGWRNVWHEGRWWYWTAANRWMYYEGGRWVHFEPADGRAITRPVAQTTDNQTPPDPSAAPVTGNQAPCPTPAYVPSYGQCAPSGYSGVSFGTHGGAISFGF
ncbi:MAG: hypothetical protein ABR915_21560 [Thermoguttaceae bacterium]|jgi:hypothetical protein